MRYLYSILVLFLLLHPFTLLGQNQDAASARIRDLNIRYRERQLNAVQYSDSIAVWQQETNDAGIFFDQRILLELLQPYKDLAWSASRYYKSKIRYFSWLAANATLRSRTGEALYYYSKLEEEIEKQTGNKALYTMGARCIFYNKYANYPELIKTYVDGKGYDILKTYPLKLKNKQIDTTIANRYIDLIGPVIIAYSSTKDTANVNKTIAIATDIGTEMLQQISPEGLLASNIRQEAARWEFYRQLYLYKHTAKALQLLRDQQQLIQSDKLLSRQQTAAEWEDLYINFMHAHLEAKNYDSVEYYIRKLDQLPFHSADADKETSKARGMMLYARGEYKAAYESLKLANDKEQQLVLKLLDETQETLYAHAEAEYNRTELAAADRVKQRRLNWIVAVSALACSSMLIAYILFRSQRNRYNRRLRTLDNMTEMQIIEAEKLAAKAEQKKLGQDLHDDLSASLAVLIQQLNALSMQTRDSETGQLVAGIKKQADIIYDAVRSKSHLLYHSSSDHESDTLGQHIQKIVDIALPAITFHKEIDIDPGTAYHLTLEQRIAFLRIIQEAVTNIVKHAQSATEVFIFLYHNQEKIILEIGDNGVGMKNKSGKGIGLASIRSRVEEMQGTFELNGEKGTLLKICIPFEPKESNG